MINPDHKEKILKGADELFKKYGIRSISMDDIAHHLSMSKKTIYQIFSEKDELVLEVIKIRLFQLRSVMNELNDDSKEPVGNLCRLYRALTNAFEEMHDTMIFDIHKYHPKVWEVVVDFKMSLKNILTDNLKRGVIEGFFREDIDSDVSAIFSLEMVKMVYDEKFYPHSTYTPAQLHKTLFEQFIYGIVSEKGKKLYKKYKSTYE